MVDVTEVVADLDGESADLDAMVDRLEPGDWARETPAKGWTIAHQIAHLAWTDEIAFVSATDPDGFRTMLEQAGGRIMTEVDDAAAEGAQRPGKVLLARWRAVRGQLRDALLAVEPGVKVPWFGPPMSAASMVTARLMETWAHGQDVADGLGVHRAPTSRLRHVAYLAVRTRDFTYHLNGRTPPAEPFRVELTGPSFEPWAWGPEDAKQRITGTALDFCLLATQRRHRADCDVRAEGADADQWLDIAQAFAGPAGEGRAPGQFA